MTFLIFLELLYICRVLFCINQNLIANNNKKGVYYADGKYTSKKFDDFERNQKHLD